MDKIDYRDPESIIKSNFDISKIKFHLKVLYEQLKNSYSSELHNSRKNDLYAKNKALIHSLNELKQLEDDIASLKANQAVLEKSLKFYTNLYI